MVHVEERVRVTARMSNDRGDVVVGWLTRLLVIFAIVGVALIDCVSVVRAHFGAQGDADLAASNASQAFAVRHSTADAYAAALMVATGNEETIDKHSFRVDKAGNVSLKLTRTAQTVALEHLSPLRKFGVITSLGTATAPSGSAAAP
jgi:hypothetical protein